MSMAAFFQSTHCGKTFEKVCSAPQSCLWCLKCSSVNSSAFKSSCNEALAAVRRLQNNLPRPTYEHQMTALPCAELVLSTPCAACTASAEVCCAAVVISVVTGMPTGRAVGMLIFDLLNIRNESCGAIFKYKRHPLSDARLTGKSI